MPELARNVVSWRCENSVKLDAKNHDISHKKGIVQSAAVLLRVTAQLELCAMTRCH
jgi:hypothetical protein